MNSRIKIYGIITVLLWTAVIAGSLLLNVREARRSHIEYARSEARGAFFKDVIYRHWVAAAGGVYVPEESGIEPNPYLARSPRRDITTTGGDRLTLVNPAYMTRMVHELERGRHDLYGHITSLDPLRPQNAPDSWERRALESFQGGNTELSTIQEIDGEPHLRLMRPLVTEESCLACHAEQGYKAGDIRGGISVAIPLEPYYSMLWKTSQGLFTWHAFIWIFGIAGIALTTGAINAYTSKKDDLENVLREHQHELEETVADRTRELEQKTAQLEEELHRHEKLEAALKQSEEKFRMAVEATNEGLWDLDLSTGHVYYSARWAEILGYRPDEVDGSYDFWKERIHPDDTAAVDDSIKKHFYGETPFFRIEHRLRGKAGGYIWVLGRGKVSKRAGDGSPLRVTGTMTDIRERKRAEEALRDSERKYRAIFEGAGEGILIADSETAQFKYANPAICDMLGYSEEELLGMNLMDIHPEDMHQEVIETFKAQARQEINFAEDIPCLRKDGAVFYADIIASNIDLDGRMHIAGFFTDITPRKKMQDDLHRSENLLRDFLDSANDLIQIVSPGGALLYTNKAWRDTLGYSDEETDGLNIADIIHPECLDHCMNIFNRVLSGERVDYVDAVFVTKGGERIDVEGNINCRYENGKPLSTRGIFRDVTERNRMIGELRDSESNLNSIMENSPNVISLKDINGNFIFVNRMFEQVFGVSRDDIVSGNDYDLFPSEVANIIRKGDRQVLETGKQMRFEETLFAGSSPHAYLTIKFPIESDAGEPIAICSMATDISEMKEIEHALKSLSGATVSHTGEKFFNSLAKSLAHVFKVRFVSIGECVPNDSAAVRPLAVYKDGKVEKTDEWSRLDGTPGLKAVENRQLVVLPERAGEYFPGGPLFEDLNTESYLGVPLFDSAGSVCGILTIIDDMPMTGIENKIPIIEMFAVRIGAELERLRMQTQLMLHKENLEDIVEARTAELTKLNKRMSRFSQKIIQAQEHEREKLSRELHDQLGQLITALSMGVEWLRIQSGLDQNRVALLADVTEKISIETRRICKGLRPMSLDRLGLSRSLEELAGQFHELSGIKPELDFSGLNGTKFHPDVEINIYRIVQEALTNISKYSGAENVTLKIETDDSSLKMSIADDGKGIPDVENPGYGYGLLGMKERAMLCGGALDIRSAPGQGASITLTIPL